MTTTAAGPNRDAQSNDEEDLDELESICGKASNDPVDDDVEIRSIYGNAYAYPSAQCPHHHNPTYYNDEAYVASPTPQFIGPVPAKGVSPFDAYSKHLLASFFRQQAFLSSTPPEEAKRRLNTKRCIQIRKAWDKQSQEWNRAVRDYDPSAVDLARLKKSDLLGLVRHIEDSLRQRHTVSVRLATWIWAILAKIDPSTLESPEMGIMRDMAKEAIKCQLKRDHKIHKADREALKEVAGDSTGGSEEARGRDKTACISSQDRRRNTSSLSSTGRRRYSSSPSPVRKELTCGSSPLPHDLNTTVALDMIILIVGEVYGQRDLLKSRQEWKSE